MAQRKKRTVLVYGRTNSGKSYQIGEVAEDIFKKTKKVTRLATADRGGTNTIAPQVDEKIIEVVEMGDTDPWIFLNKVVRGYVRDEKGKWVLGKNENVGMFAFESIRSIAESLMQSMAAKAAMGVNIGGGANVAFTIAEGGDTLKISGNNMAHYGVAQSRMTEEIWESQRLNADYIMWTSSVSKDDDTTASGKVLGPDFIGKALTGEGPRWFDLTFRIDALPATMGKPERHVLYLGNHTDPGAGNATGLGNIRMPAGAPPLPLTIEPASLVKALELIDAGYAASREALKKRLA